MNRKDAGRRASVTAAAIAASLLAAAALSACAALGGPYSGEQEPHDVLPDGYRELGAPILPGTSRKVGTSIGYHYWVVQGDGSSRSAQHCLVVASYDEDGPLGSSCGERSAGYGGPGPAVYFFPYGVPPEYRDDAEYTFLTEWVVVADRFVTRSD